MERNRKTIAAVFAAMLFAIAAFPQDRPLPLDPLTNEERELASEVARADRRVREFLDGGRSRELNVEFIAVKRIRETDAQKDEPSRRYAEVLYIRYDLNTGLRALVDLADRVVLDTVSVPGRSLATSLEEVEEAARIAFADARVIRLFGGRVPPLRVARGPAVGDELEASRIEGLRTLGSTPDDPCFRGRCIVLFFRENNRYRLMNEVVVDLTRGRVLLRGGEQ